MPTYDYRCTACKKPFEQFRPIADRDAPVKEPCPMCGSSDCVERAFIEAPLTGADAALRPPSDFGRVLDRIKSGIPKQFRDGLDSSKNPRLARYVSKPGKGKK